MTRKIKLESVGDFAKKNKKGIALSVLTFVIFYIILSVVLAKFYRDKVMPQYYFLGGSLNAIPATELQNHIADQMTKISSMHIIRSRSDELPTEDFIVSTLGGVSLKPDALLNIEYLTFKGSWLESYKIFFGFFRPKVDLGQDWLMVDSKVLRENYLKKDGLVTTLGKGDAHLTMLPDGRMAISQSVPEVSDAFYGIEKSFQYVFKGNDYTPPIYVVQPQTPKVTTNDWQSQLPTVKSLIDSNSYVNLFYGGSSLGISSSQLPKLLTITDSKTLAISPAYLEQYLHESVLGRWEIKPSEPLFIYDKERMRVLSFKKEVMGKKFETEKLANQLTKELLINPGEKKILNKRLELTNWQPQKTLVDTNPFGIKELLGTGYSSMRGSAPERFANINNGINKLDGYLLAPGAEFSTIGALSPFTIANGYVEGLAIKKRKILPEVGGGMCQVSTTLFRAAMNSGLLITDRSNHSIVVNYYDDPRNGLPGTDATIYEPALDFKFKNDTQNYVLIDTRVEAGGQIYFDIWGISDGRKGYFTTPRVLSRTTSTEEPVYDLSSSVPLGQVRCSGPFNGMSTIFTYIRTLANGKTESVPYFSYYRPQGQNCLVGM